ncbi:KAP family NTPase [Photobacterium sp. ZSDE20]|uniref:KAP family NTPase n=1 Tax=Photobacterium pectinilyticum TaxID=2906793 RepID=A0ABT1N6F8_9GAMM|nr:P-loop NTPase fold protein [Photobacterium sp. ZSDE20]MCQ1060122.1 KAP family NTPase [Photobacterium sp. ZSDE20]MDD1827578.1 KAP family NTPase [Photobacterium sp. ZSDE20]
MLFIIGRHIPPSSLLFMFLLGVSALQTKPFFSILPDWLTNPANISWENGGISAALLLAPAAQYLGMRFFNRDLQLGDLLKRNSTDTINETLEVNREVGAIELRQAFKVFADLIPAGKTIVLVIDNIDRVSPEIARELWSDIDTLISLGSPRFRILLPYSEKHLSKALEQGAIEASQSGGKEYISKRIPIPFTAPPIASTGWRERFEQYWSETLPDIEGKAGVMEMIDIWQRDVTPRFLKSLINRIGTRIDSCSESNKDLHGASCAAYLLVVRDNDIHLHQLVGEPDSKELDEAILRKMHATQKVLRKYTGSLTDWPKHIAALHYQTSFEIASSELIIQPLRAAFNSHDAPRIIDLSSLHGFEVFFKKQTENTDAPDLVKLMAALVETSEGKALVEHFLADFNHELVQHSDPLDEFDAELIDCFNSLITAGIDVDVSIPTVEQRNLTNAVLNRTNSLLRANKPKDLATNNEQWEKVMNLIRQIYQYFTVTGKKPLFITRPSADTLVNFLYPLRNAVPDWEIDKQMASIPLDRLVVAACLRQSSLSENDTVFPQLLTMMRCGAMDKVEGFSYLPTISIASADLETVLTLLPFTADWQQLKSNPDQTIPPLSELLQRTKNEGMVDKTTLARLSALTAAALACAYVPDHGFVLPNEYGKNQHQNVVSWLETFVTVKSGAPEYLVNYLSFVPFDQLLKWCNSSVMEGQFLAPVAELMRTERIASNDAELILSTYYTGLKNQLPDFDAQELLSWIAERPVANLTPEKWQTESIVDILASDADKVQALKQILIDYFDATGLYESDWLKTLIHKEPVEHHVAQYYVNNSLTLTESKPLMVALEKALTEKRQFDAGWVRLLFDVLDGDHQRRLLNKVKAQFFKTSTSDDQKYRSISFFGDRLAMPPLDDDAAIEQALAFLDNAINNFEGAAIDWLSKQPVDGFGWNLSAWSESNLSTLNDYLSEQADSPLKKAVDARFGANTNRESVA